MIINALCEYYDILVDCEESMISKEGYEQTTVQNCAVIDVQGELKKIISLVGNNGKFGQVFSMPLTMKTSSISASPVCDKTEYIFGIGLAKDANSSELVPTKEIMKFEKAKELHLSMFKNAVSEEGIAIRRFFENWDLEKAWKNEIIQKYYEENKQGFKGNISFRLSGQSKYFHESNEIVDLWIKKNDEKAQARGAHFSQCCITGKKQPIAKLHKQLMGVKGANTMGASLVCFNKDADCSYHMEQGYNASVSEGAMFKYTTLLQHLISGEGNKLFLGDDTVVFWAKSKNFIYQNIFQGMFSDVGDQEELGVEPRDTSIGEIVKTILEKGGKGVCAYPNINPETPFYILGLSPNAGRISVRFFYHNAFQVFCDKVQQHHKDIEIYGGKKGANPIKIESLLSGTISNKSKDKKMNPLLGGAVVKSILTGCAYPQILLNQAVMRCKVETSVKQVQAAAIKGFLVRRERALEKEEHIGMYLNTESKNIPYVLGRMFAILEKAQRDALGQSINATIRDQFFAVACCNPSRIFPNLMKLSNHHFAKIKSNFRQMELHKCMSLLEVDGFPTTLNIEDQGRFILGYYQQSRELYQR